MREAFRDWKPNENSLSLVRIANAICAEMKAQGYDLTLRQLYYQFVARGYIPNNLRSYKNLGSVIDRARLAGLLDWDYLEDRTRSLAGFYHSDDMQDFLNVNQRRYHLDHWAGQTERVEVWVEKEALVSVVGRTAARFDVDYFACRGYVSQSEMYVAAQRHANYEAEGAQVTIIHLGDHDPSGIDMTRDVQDRLEMFGVGTEVVRIALNMDQVDQYSPPPNPAKFTDSRAGSYVAAYGRSSWELDALTPAVIDGLVEAEIRRHIDVDMWDEVAVQQRGERELLETIALRWDDVREYVENDLA